MANYHVDYINGSDTTGDGSAGNPWGTVVHALTTSAAGAGDEVRVAGSGLTTVDSTAVLSAVDTLTTTTDLTSSIAVGDIVVVYPNGVTEYENWVTLYVVAITSTTIQFYEDIYMPGDWNVPLTGGSGTYTIKTIDSVYSSTAGTLEDFASQLGAGADVTGGWDATFTSIIGLTYIRRGGLGGGSASGTGWLFRTNNNNINQANFRNFHFSQWSKGIDTEYGSSYFGDNLHFYFCNSESQGSFGLVYNKAGGPSNLYFINSDGRVGIGAYQANFLNAGYDAEMNVYQFLGNENVEFTVASAITKMVTWNPGMNSFGAAFGRTYNYRSNANSFKDCQYITNIIEENRGTFSGINQNIILFNNASGNIDSLTLIDGNATRDWFFALDDLSGGYTGSAKFTLKLPATFDLTSAAILPHLAGGRDTSAVSGRTNNNFVDTNGAWQPTDGGTYETVNATDYSTGNSSRQVILTSRMAYAAADPRTLLALVTKTTAAPPTSIDIVYKYTGTSFGTRLYFSDPLPTGEIELTTGNVNLTGDGTWRTASYTCGSNTLFTEYWNNIGIGSRWGIQFVALFYNQVPKSLLIDSITVNY